MAYAQAELELSRKMPDGRTYRQHLEVAAVRSAAALAELQAAAELADPAVIIPWQWFMEVSARRGSNGFAANPVSYADVEAWERRVGIRLREHEVGWMFELDRLFLESLASEVKKK